MRILGIETSCDETSAAVVEDGTKVLSCVIASSKKDFQSVGGVIPEEAARRQQETMLPVIEKALSDAGLRLDEIDAIAVTTGPGLLGSLLVGTMTARTLSTLSEKPLLPVHHIFGHLSSTWLDQESEPIFPMLTLSVSGGHTELRYRRSHTEQTLVATTLDDAAGEAFDKGAQMLGLPYPGGPALAALAEKGDESFHDFPIHTGDNFSFSGLKTSLKYFLHDRSGPEALSTDERASVAASFQRAIVLQLTRRIEKAFGEYPKTKELHVGGGVSANTRLRAELSRIADDHAVTLRTPMTLRYCTDNAAMIASAGFFLFKEDANITKKVWTTQAQTAL